MGVDKANLTPHVSANRHHGQGDGSGHPWAFRLHWQNESIDEVVDMGRNAGRLLLPHYINCDTASFETAFNGWIQTSAASASAKAKATDFRIALWEWQDQGGA